MASHEGLDWGNSYPRRAVAVSVQAQTPAPNFRGINHTYQFNRWLVVPRADWTHRRRGNPLVHTEVR